MRLSSGRGLGISTLQMAGVGELVRQMCFSLWHLLKDFFFYFFFSPNDSSSSRLTQYWAKNKGRGKDFLKLPAGRHPRYLLHTIFSLKMRLLVCQAT